MRFAATLLAWALAFAVQPADVDWRTVAPGVEYAHITRDGPQKVYLIRTDLTRARLDVVHARNDAVSVEPLSAIAARVGAVAAINGGYFRMTGAFPGDSTGTLQIDGRLLSEPDRGRAAVGLLRTPRGTRLLMGHVTWRATVRVGSHTRRLNGINRPRGRNEAVLFTPEFSDTTLTDDTGTEAVVRDGRVAEIREATGRSGIPRDGFVISTTGTARAWARARLTRGATVAVSMALRPVESTATNPWADAEDILGAGPKLVSNGRVDITTGREKMRPAFAAERHPRTAIASLRDGRALLLAVDGRQPSFSLGMTLPEMARLLVELGALEAINLDGGGSTTMVVNGAIVNRPSDLTGERPISDAIVVSSATASGR